MSEGENVRGGERKGEGERGRGERGKIAQLPIPHYQY